MEWSTCNDFCPRQSSAERLNWDLGQEFNERLRKNKKSLQNGCSRLLTLRIRNERVENSKLTERMLEFWNDHLMDPSKRQHGYKIVGKI